MANVYGIEQILQAVRDYDPIVSMEEGFLEYSRGNVVVPPVGEMIFDDAEGEVHIKYGYIKNDEYYVVKIASGFYGNSTLNLPSTQGLIVVASQRTGQIEAILDDEGYLTNLRTAAAGAVVAKYFAPKKVHRIGILGAGTQARMQATSLRNVVDCTALCVWNRNLRRAYVYKDEMECIGFTVRVCDSPTEVAALCNLVVTCTPSHEPLLLASDIRRGMHITAMGSDTAEKNEIDSSILRSADVIVVDSVEQSRQRGEVYQAEMRGVKLKRVVELGKVIGQYEPGRVSDDEVSVADLTGLAIQDIQIAKAVLRAIKKHS